VVVAQGARFAVEFVQFLDGADLLLLLHAPVLEPDLDLTLGEVEGDRQFDAAPPRQVAVEVELLLELKRLVPRVRLTAASTLRRVRSCTEQHRTRGLAIAIASAAN